jgi:hypothetical protein
MATAKTTKPTDENVLELVVDGKSYSINLDDLTVDEIEVIEDEFDKPAEELTSSDWKRTKMLRCIVYFLLRRDGQEVTLEEIGDLKLSDIGEPDGPPTKRQSAAKP